MTTVQTNMTAIIIANSCLINIDLSQKSCEKKVIVDEGCPSGARGHVSGLVTRGAWFVTNKPACEEIIVELNLRKQ